MEMRKGVSIERGRDDMSLHSNNSLFSQVSRVLEDETYAAVQKILDLALARANKEKRRVSTPSKAKSASSTTLGDPLLAKLA